jgi:hypothetical protein
LHKRKRKGDGSIWFSARWKFRRDNASQNENIPHKQLEILYHGWETTYIIATMHGQQLENFQEFG